MPSRSNGLYGFGILRPLLVTAERERRDGDDRGVGGGRLRAEPASGLEAGDLAELDVHEDQVRTLLRGHRHAGFPVSSST
jgi:hypothetical protein